MNSKEDEFISQNIRETHAQSSGTTNDNQPNTPLKRGGVVSNISTIMMAIGILGGIMCMLHGTLREYEFSPEIFTTGVILISFSILNHAFVQVVIRISRILKSRDHSKHESQNRA